MHMQRCREAVAELALEAATFEAATFGPTSITQLCLSTHHNFPTAAKHYSQAVTPRPCTRSLPGR